MKKFLFCLKFISANSSSLLLLLLQLLLLLSAQARNCRSHMTQVASFVFGLPACPFVEQILRCTHSSSRISLRGYPVEPSRRLALDSATASTVSRLFGSNLWNCLAHSSLTKLRRIAVLQRQQLCTSSSSSNNNNSWLCGFWRGTCAFSSRANTFLSSPGDSGDSAESRCCSSDGISSSSIKLYTLSERVRGLEDSSPSHVRNFSIVAHVDHGKSSVSNAILRRLGSIDPKRDSSFLDSLGEFLSPCCVRQMYG